MDDRRHKEDYLPIQAISTEALGDKSVLIYNSLAKLDHAKRELVAARFHEIPAEAIVQAAIKEELT